ncbi:PREDICTED: plant intracellular Ras-group-related LRR protein 2 [Camelina sativa]|uniref:Plant intracellular Ras-group-related LRR protein 2 n=1 Tax=Camelina sativa TaxID=90675 RepID=A0ABM1QGS9_CAMSA|nr:PREDICTED: plant intracellular Ras-group-related LRR protein 2 [Camelina sativa]
MDHDLDKFPLLSYVLHQLDSNLHAPPSMAAQQTLLPSFPLLSDPQVMSSLTQFIPTTITQTLSVYNSLGSRPDPLAVSSARSKIAQIMDSLSPEAAAKETELYTGVVRLDEVHDSYEKKLKDLEEELSRVYATKVESMLRSGQEVNEEVLAVLKAAESGGIVERIDLSGQELKLLPEAFGKIVGLVYLNLSRNDLTFIPDAISKLKNLEELDVSSNSLESLPDSIGMLLNLRILNVNGNSLTTLPESIAHCRSLVELDASYNNLTSLPTNIGYGLQNLEKLSIQLNKLRYFPGSISEMYNLKYLDAHMNEIHGIPNSVGRLTKLEVLNLSSNFNNLMGVPDTITDLTNLRDLDLSNNQIQTIPDSFYRLRKLEKLNLDQNPLEIPSQEVAKQGAEAVRKFMRKRWDEIMAEQQQRIGVEAERHGDETGWVYWGTSMVTNLVSGMTQTIGLGGGSSDGKDKKPGDSYYYHQL